MDQLTFRQTKVFKTIVDEFIRTAEPVGSKTYSHCLISTAHQRRCAMKWQRLKKWGCLKKHIHLAAAYLLLKVIGIMLIT